MRRERAACGGRCRNLTDPRVLALAEQLRTRLKVSRRVRFLVCDEIGVPSMLGILHPAVLLPVTMMTGVPLEQLRAILAHELAHVRRWDYLANLAQMLVEALLFFNPFVWWISRQMRLEREACCDQVAAGECPSPALYVEALVAVVERSRSAAPPPALAASGPNRDRHSGNALDRARRLLVPGYQPALRLRWFSLAAVLALSGLALSGLWLGTRAVAQTIQASETKAKPDVSPPPLPAPESFKATVSTEDGTPAVDDSATAYICESSGSNSSGTGAFGINQPGPVLFNSHEKGWFTLRPRADSRTLSCAVTMRGYAAVFAGPFVPPFKELKNIHFTLRKGYTASVETVDEAGQPIAGARLEAYYPGPPQVALGEAKTDASGTAPLEHVGEAPLNMRAYVDGFQIDEIKNVRLDPAKPYRWTLKRGLRTAGIVTDEFHRPIAGATVKLAGVRGALDITNLGPDGASLLATADATGGFALTALRADCRYCFFVEAPGYSGVYVRNYNPVSGGLLVNLGPELLVRGKVVHIPDSAFFLDGVPLFYSQSFMYQDNGFGSAQRSLNLHPKNGEADFSIGPFFMTQTGSTPGMSAPWDNGQVALHIDGFPEVKITVEDMKGFQPLLKIPKFGITYDLAEKTPPVVTPAALLSRLADKPSASRTGASESANSRVFDAKRPATASPTPSSPVPAASPIKDATLASNPPEGYALRNAAGEGRIETVGALLDHGANINFQDEHGFTSLSWAAYCGKEDVCLLLLERGADGRIEDQDGRNAAWHAAAGPHCAEALMRMIKAGVPVTGKDKQGNTILDYMMSYGMPEVGDRFSMKVYAAADIERYDESERPVVELLLATGVDPNGGGSDVPLVRAMHNRHYAAARVLLAHDADPARKDKDGDTALYDLIGYAVDRPLPLDLFKTLWQRSGSLNPEFTVQGVTPPAKTSLLEMIIDGAGPNPVQKPSFHKAIKIMLDGGVTFAGVADANAQVLLQAAARGDLAAIQRSVGQGAPVSAADDRGWDALSITTALGYYDCADWLIDHGADVNGRHRGPWNAPLPRAIMGGQADLVEKLLAKGRDAQRRLQRHVYGCAVEEHANFRGVAQGRG